jgi:hypothetical protein
MGFNSASKGLISNVDGVEWSSLRPGRFNLAKELQYRMNSGLGGPQNQSGRLREDKNLFTQTEFELRIVQPVVRIW